MPGLARENTLPSFQLALDAGANGIELDVHATSDGVVVVHHDADLADGSRIAEQSFAELRRREAAPGIAIPTLDEVCELVAGRATLFVELKGAGIEERVLDRMGSYTGEYALHSFDHDMIRRARVLDSTVRLGILVEDSGADVASQLERAGATDLWPHWPLVTPSLVAAVHGVGARVIPWTVNDATRAEWLASIGVDGLCGDDVRMFPAR